MSWTGIPWRWPAHHTLGPTDSFFSRLIESLKNSLMHLTQFPQLLTCHHILFPLHQCIYIPIIFFFFQTIWGQASDMRPHLPQTLYFSKTRTLANLSIMQSSNSGNGHLSNTTAPSTDPIHILQRSKVSVAFWSRISAMNTHRIWLASSVPSNLEDSSVFPWFSYPSSFWEWISHLFPYDQIQAMLSWKENTRNDVGLSPCSTSGNTRHPSIPSLMMSASITWSRQSLPGLSTMKSHFPLQWGEPYVCPCLVPGKFLACHKGRKL